MSKMETMVSPPTYSSYGRRERGRGDAKPRRGKDPRKILTTFNLEEIHLLKMDLAIKTGLVSTHSELIRNAIINKLGKIANIADFFKDFDDQFDFFNPVFLNTIKFANRIDLDPQEFKRKFEFFF